jgi:putative ABC transport system permease protein
VAGANDVPGRRFNNSAFIPEGVLGDQSHLLWRLSTDDDFLETMGMTIVEGRGFSDKSSSDSTAAILNQTAVDYLGWGENPVGKRLIAPGRTATEEVTFTVIGVVQDFHFESLREEIRPLIIQNAAHPETSNIDDVVIRLRTNDYPATLAKIKETWKSLAPDQPFEYSFLSDNLDKLYRADQKTAEIAGSFSAMAIVIGCLGLFGLTSFMAEQRTKEIGVRKTLGASVSSVVQLLSKDIVKLVAVGNLIAWPIAYYLMDQWLADFAYRTTLGVGPFLMGGGVAFLVSAMTVGYQTVKAARQDPVTALRYE